MTVELGGNKFDEDGSRIALLSIYRESEEYATTFDACVIGAPPWAILWPLTYTTCAAELVDDARIGWLA